MHHGRGQSDATTSRSDFGRPLNAWVKRGLRWEFLRQCKDKSSHWYIDIKWYKVNILSRKKIVSRHSGAKSILFLMHSEASDDRKMIRWRQAILQRSIYLEVKDFQRSAPENPINVPMDHPMAKGWRTFCVQGRGGSWFVAMEGWERCFISGTKLTTSISEAKRTKHCERWFRYSTAIPLEAIEISRHDGREVFACRRWDLLKFIQDMYYEFRS